MKNLAIVTWTHTEMEDVFPVYFGNLKKHFPEHLSCNNYVLINKLSEKISDDYTQLINNDKDSYFSRLLSCLEYVKDDYFLYLQEDFILFDDVNFSEFERCFNYLNTSNHSCIRFVRSNLNNLNNKEDHNIYKISHDENPDLSFTQVASIWRKNDFIKVIEELKPLTFRDLEAKGDFPASKIMKNFGLNSCFYFDKSSTQRKLFEKYNSHWNDKCFPYTATSIVEGKWNMQYSKEINLFSEEYGFNIKERGTIN